MEKLNYIEAMTYSVIFGVCIALVINVILNHKENK